jgi:hypothetical protein
MTQQKTPLPTILLLLRQSEPQKIPTFSCGLKAGAQKRPPFTGWSAEALGCLMMS